MYKYEKHTCVLHVASDVSIEMHKDFKKMYYVLFEPFTSLRVSSVFINWKKNENKTNIGIFLFFSNDNNNNQVSFTDLTKTDRWDYPCIMGRLTNGSLKRDQ